MLNRIALTWLCLGFLATVPAVHAGAAPERKYVFEGEDITPFVTYFEKKVRALAKPVTVYTWSTNGDKPFWKMERPQGDPALVQSVHAMARSFWSQYGNPKSQGNMYGYGFYAALDPIATASFGGITSYISNSAELAPWLLTETRLVPGFRLIDVGSSYMADLESLAPDAEPAIEVALRFKCPSTVSAAGLFESGGAGLEPKCQGLVREVFQKILKIDGFAYVYGRTTFKACDSSFDNYRAIVIVRPDRIGPQDVKIYTRGTKSDLEDRIRIQTLFLTEAAEKKTAEVGGAARSVILLHLRKNPDSFVKGSTTKCAGATCVITIHFCDDKNQCEDVNLDPLPRPGGPTITKEEAMGTEARGLFWPDLEGQPKATTIQTWLKENMYGCSGELPFAPESAASASEASQ